ncbi:MAG TPA: M1 family metallopeptidase [Sphingomonas sp.]|nr:M1 family metallopeptidase [Sphingomonas sp.]
MRSRLLAVLALALAVAGCQGGDKATGNAAETAAAPIPPILLTPQAEDIHSYANPREARVTHVALDLQADFTDHVLAGTARLDIAAAPKAQKVVLDTDHLTITSVTDDRGRALPYRLGPADPIHGAPLTVQLGAARTIVVSYKTAPGAKALQWLSPEQTLGKKLPFLFSQGEPILNRSWIPTQDSPGIRQTWEAQITVPEGMNVVMSGTRVSALGSLTSGNRRTFTFKMDKPVPPYLIALAIGDLRFKAISDNTGVWAEPSMVDKAANEFADLPRFLDAAEDLYGSYRWDRYDLLILPPSFPYGGMENPMLTFVTPTAIAGDRSLVSLAAHELAHSWSGNLVTNATWNDFWLNEGFTTYAEGRIMEAVYGADREAMEQDLMWSDLQDTIKELGGPDSPMTKLHVDIPASKDPDTGMTQIAYDKGAEFLMTIEKAVGRDRFDAWLKGYFDRHAFQPQTSAGFLKDIRATLFKDDPAAATKIGLDRWVYQPGVPANAIHVESSAFEAIDKAARLFARTGEASALPGNMVTHEAIRFLDDLPRDIGTKKLAALDGRFHWNDTSNSEIRFAWLDLALANHYPPASASAEAFLTGQGRLKFVEPLYTLLIKESGWGPPLARQIYAKARPGYHPVTQAAVDAIVGRPGAPTAE